MSRERPRPRRGAPEPTDGELEILQVLWDRGAATVRDVHDAIGAAKGIGYTTILKLMQIMVDKGLARRDESQRTHVYAAAVERQTTERRLVGTLLDRAFHGSAARLVLSALQARPASAQELDEIRRLIDEARPQPDAKSQRGTPSATRADARPRQGRRR